MRIKELRLENHLTQVELADIIGTSHKNISKYENLQREPDISTLVKIADYFNVTLDYLVGRSFHHNYATFDSPKLSQNEQQVLQLFNTLTKHNQDLLLERAKTMIDLQKEVNSTTALTPKKGA